MSDYDPQTIEPKWRAFWEQDDTFACDLDDRDRPKFYMLSMYPYPSGALHIGHVMEYTIGDVIARYRRATGHNVLFPIGWDSFGLPAENAAIKHDIDPATFTYGNIERMREQMQRAGWSAYWPSEIATSHPGYYHWNQWIFLKMHEHGLVYRKDSAVNWCPKCMTVLANEQVVDGLCERHGTEVELKQLEQWFFRITDYAQRMLDDFPAGWDPKVVAMQRAWIGRSEGAEIVFAIEGRDETLPVFTTRPDTLYGVTFVSLAPEHPLVAELCAGTEHEAAVTEFVQRVTRIPSFERNAEGAPKEGVFTGRYAIHPLSGERVQLWVANYALMDYGTGAVMAVPAHDQRDFEFARAYDIEVKVVIQPEGDDLDAADLTEAYTGPGRLVRSGPFDGTDNQAAIAAIAAHLGEVDSGGSTISYRLRDWLVSRQRYWGTPIPMVHCDGCGVVPVPEDQLPVELPPGVDFRPTGESPLASVPEFVNTTCPRCAGPARRETDTMDTFVDSSWYFFRYLSARDSTRALDPERVAYWLPIDQYVGGIEHANGHLVFSRYFTKFLQDAGVQPHSEYAHKLFTHGMVCMVAHNCPNHSWLPRDQVVDGTCAQCGSQVRSELTKMSKTKLNVVDPTALFNQYGADATRLYILFMGPPSKSTEYNDNGLIGAFRFLQRLHGLVHKHAPGVADVEAYAGDGSDLSSDAKKLRSRIHRTIAKVGHDNENFGFNTAVSAIMELVNDTRACSDAPPALIRSALETTVVLLHPMTPHVCEELWEVLGHAPSVQRAPWPSHDPEVAKGDEIEVVFQVNGKVRGKQTVAQGTDDDTLKALALANDGVQRTLDGREPRRVIVVKGRLVNVVG